MTTPTPPARTREWWTRPGVVLPIVATVAIIVALLTPQAAQGRFGDSRLTTHSAGSMGARVLYDMSARLGWRVIQNDSQATPTATQGKTIHAMLAAVTPVMPEEAHAYLEAVRGGDALLLVLGAKTPLSDSLGVTHFTRGGMLPPYSAVTGECVDKLDFTPPLWPDGKVRLFGVRWLRGAPAEQEIFARLDGSDIASPVPGEAAVGIPYGRGRIIIVADPDLLRNDVLRRCNWGVDVIAARMLEWLRAGDGPPRTTLVFDEYHQGYGSRPSVFTVTGSFLADHPLGRAIVLAVVAAIVLLLAVSPRAIKPQHVERVERRDPLEQVDALAHAYEQVRATRTITARLVRGMRWRVERGGSAARARADDVFLDDIAERNPSLSGDVAVVKDALREPVPDRDLPEIGAALRRIEHTLTSHVS
ncbi:MAG: DUF4350 domain-containing protein [bacterium]